jgi:hypothetical protein
VFFSFHYERDVRRIQQVRNSWVARPQGEATPFYDAAEFENAKRRAGGIQHWIDGQLKGTSVTVVLYGAQTHLREWVGYEIEKSHEMGKGILAIDIHNVRDPLNGTDYQGQNPLGNWHVTRGGRKTYLSELYGDFDWVHDDGYHNMAGWIEDAARAAGR